MREYIEFLEDRIKQLEAGYLNVCQELLDERNHVTMLKDTLSAANAKVSTLQDELDSQQLSYARMKTRPDLIKFYTGIDTEAMEFLLYIVGDAARESCRHNMLDTSAFDGHDSRGRKRKLKPEDELLLTLCKLRHNFPQDDLAMRFCVNQSPVSRIFSCWTEILEACVNEFPLWPDKISVQEDMPAAFQNLYAETHVSIDAAEIEINRPGNPDTQSLTWSEYKSRITAKFLLTVTPNGVPCFVSQCFGGGISGSWFNVPDFWAKLSAKNDLRQVTPLWQIRVLTLVNC